MKNRLSFLITYYVYVNWIDDWFEWRNKMQKEAIHQLIVKLTLNKNWLNDPMIVNQVKYLGDQLSCTRRSPINYNQIQGINVYYLDGYEKMYTSLKSCCEGEKLFKGTIQKYILSDSPIADGRYFCVIR